MEGANKPFKKLVTAYLINKLMTDQTYVFRKYTYLKNVSSDLMNKLSVLEDYRNKNYRDGSTEIYTAMLELAQENNLFDYSIYHEYIRMKETLEKLYFLNSILGSLNLYSYNSSLPLGVERAIVDLMKYHKFKVDLKHYTRPTEEKLEEEVC